MQLKPLVSYCKRSGRITSGAKKALEESPYLRAPEDLYLPENVSKTLDIGFGMGHSILTLAEQNPHRMYVGVEVHTPGVGKVLSQIQQKNIHNIYVLHTDVNNVLPYLQGFDEVLLWFPDPWPKRYHHKRRLVSAEFLKKIFDILAPNGRLHMATDWEDYAKHMLKVSQESEYFTNSFGGYATGIVRPLTKFCARGRQLQHGEWDIVLTKKSI